MASKSVVNAGGCFRDHASWSSPGQWRWIRWSWLGLQDNDMLAADGIIELGLQSEIADNAVAIDDVHGMPVHGGGARTGGHLYQPHACLLYTSDAADDLLCVDLGGRRIIKKKKN